MFSRVILIQWNSGKNSNQLAQETKWRATLANLVNLHFVNNVQLAFYIQPPVDPSKQYNIEC